MSILQHKKNIYSQNGEDGIIEFIFNRLNIKNGNFVEFGAWDGKHLSNTYNLYNNGWDGIYIEGDEKKYKDLLNNFGKENRICCLHSMVGFESNNNQDTLIEKTSFSDRTFDFVSIDVDGLDYNIFKAFTKYLPKVICIEVNAGHSPLYDKEIDISISQNNVGQSMYIINKEAEKKGYFSLCYTGNLFLVKNEYKHLFIKETKDLKNIYLDFLSHLETTNPGGLKYLYNLFVIKQIFNGFYFKNKILKEYYESVNKIQNQKINIKNIMYNNFKIA